LSKPSKTLK